jgi:GNAT superfamily N-acetyltransferase
VNDLLIRLAEQPDLVPLANLYRHLNAEDKGYPPEKAEAVFEQFLRYSGSAILLGIVEDVLVCSCTLVIIPNLTRAGMPYALIENVVTHADHRNRGFGKAILNAAVERAWAGGCYKVMLLTGSKEPSTLAFYQAAGFEQSKTGFQIRNIPVRSE